MRFDSNPMEKRVLISLYRKMPLNWASLTEQTEKNLSPVSQLRIGTYLVALQTSPLERHSLEQGILHTNNQQHPPTPKKILT